MKSRTLLPQQPEEEEEGLEAEELDPRAELVRRLLEYQKYKLVAEQLGSRSVYGRDVFGRGSAAPQAEGPAPLAQLSMFKLLDALEGILERFKQTGDHLVDFERISISDRINQLSDVLQSRGRVEFEHLFEGDRSRADVIVTFLALLEMTKLRLTTLWQEEPYAPIYIELAVREEGSEPPSAVPGAAGSEQAPGVAPDGARGAAEDLQPVVASVSEVGEAVQSPNAPAGAVDETEDARPPMASAGEADATEDIHPPTASDEESEESEPPKTFDDE
jgi:segregation and condensation protein A